MSQQKNYSIVIPHKNIPELLQRCLASIPRRDDVQIIIVDDNSDPDKVDFENFPGLGDPNIEVVFTKEGKGAGYARNVGMAKAIGKWLLFADADDFYNYCINDILDEYKNSEIDIIYFKCNSLDSEAYTTSYRHNRDNAFIDSWLNSSREAESLLRYKNTVVWAKILKSDLIKKNNILFDEISSSNDVTFSCLAGFYANKIHADPRALYCIMWRQGSISYSNNAERKFNYLYVLAKRALFFRKNNIPNRGKTLFMYYFSVLAFKQNSLSKAKEILLSLGFTKGEITNLLVCSIILYLPIRMYYAFQYRIEKLIYRTT